MNVITSPKERQLLLEISTTLDLCEIVNTPRSLTVWILLSNGEFAQYLDLPMEASNYEDVNLFRDDYLVTRILSKSPNLPLGIDRKEVAVQSFRASEALCKEVNDRFWSSPDNALPIFFWEMRRIVANILCPLTRDVVEEICDNFSHGPGATTGVRGVGSCIVDKYKQPMHLTASLIPFYRAIVGDFWAEVQNEPKIVASGSKLTTVPKNSKTDRCICVEPTLNVYVQKGIGAYIRKRLKIFGINLDIQADRNRQAAGRAHSDELCTMDLSAASDSISLVMLQRLVPPDWGHLLDIARSPVTYINGEKIILEKISSMGNGYTFELESLVFYALLCALIPKELWHEIHVFGDDLIFPRKYALVVTEALNSLGFSVNTSKSFLTGQFFESCGTDWFKGKPVRPFFLKGQSDNIPYTVQIANKLRLWSSLRYNGYVCDSRFKPLWLKLLTASPKEWRRCRVPTEMGDTGFVTSRDELLHFRPMVDQHEGLRILSISTKARKRLYTARAVLLEAYARRQTPEFPTYGEYPVRGKNGRSRPRWTSLKAWSSGLEWDLR